MGTACAGLFRLATDPSLAVRRAVCAGLVHMLQLQPALLAPQMRDVIQYMLESTQVRRNGALVFATQPPDPLQTLRSRVLQRSQTSGPPETWILISQCGPGPHLGPTNLTVKCRREGC